MFFQLNRYKLDEVELEYRSRNERNKIRLTKYGKKSKSNKHENQRMEDGVERETNKDHRPKKPKKQRNETDLGMFSVFGERLAVDLILSGVLHSPVLSSHLPPSPSPS